MALNQYNYPQPTGLQQLGDVLMKGSGDYANIQLQRQAEERRRAQQLADLQDQRQFAVEQRGVERGFANEDRTAQRQFANEDRRANALFAARLGALERAQARGLIAASDIGNVAVEDAALAKLAQAEATDVQRKEGALTNAQSELNRLATDRDSLAVKDQEIAERIRKLQEDYTATADAAEPAPVTREAVALKAAELAKAAGVKLATTEPKRSEQLGIYIEQAAKALEGEALVPAMLAQQRLKSISSQYNSLVREQGTVVDQVRNIRQTMADLQRQFPIAPVRSQSPAAALKAPPLAVEPPPAPAVANEAEREAARRAALGLPDPAAPASPASPLSAPAAGPSFSNPKIMGVPEIPEVYKAAPAANRQQSRTRRNDAISDLMRGTVTGVANLVRPSSWRFDNDFMIYDPPAERAATQLRDRLGALRDPTSPTAMSLRNRLAALDPLPPLTPNANQSLRSSAFYP